ncbi:hypothetical protein HXZ94_07150 [Empedobacter falsenii]|uniref:hypothetical protein n=1 Tax=Empedobacter falsenii TaxID=343874 RepID=UPI0025761C37|nr:hypothetical protein [Empedobacter falsenii]MDM1298276.1 hypothetical protein [Empedobacter falsenii]MDM1318167.1 hypothetical protein [Empedobacter falsenii]
MKQIILFFLILFPLIGFSQNKLIKKINLKGFDFTIEESLKPENKNNTYYEIKRVVNDSVIQNITISKESNNNEQSMVSEFKIIDDIFVFPKTYKSNDIVTYGIDRVFITEDGKFFEGTENNIEYKEKPDENNYNAQYIGGINAFRNRVAYYINASDYIQPGEIISINIKIEIDRNGNPIIQEILGKYPPKLKENLERFLKKLPRWIPAKKDNETISTYFTLPLKIGY